MGNFFSDILGGAKDLIFGSNGEMQTQQAPKWNAQQNELFKQLYGQVSPNIGKGMTPTPEESSYQTLLNNYEPFYRSTINEAYNPQAVKDYYANSIIPEAEKTILPKVEAQYGGPGYWGSARARAVSDVYSSIGRQEATDLYGVEKAKSTAIADLVNKLPVAAETAAKWSRTFTPEMAPYFNQAITLLGLQPFDTLAAYQQGSPGFLGSIMSGLGKTTGEAGGKALSSALFG